MTQITTIEIKFVLIALIFISILGAFVVLYNSSPIEESNAYTYIVDEEGDWIAGLLENLPAPFDDSTVVFITSIIMVPLSLILAFVSIRAIKDILTQWV